MTSAVVESKKRRAILLLNLGTPDSLKIRDIRKYLKEFLMDPYVIDIPFFARWFLVHGLILPTRPKKAAQAYHKIWTSQGSPLLVHLNDLTEKLQDRLAGEGWFVRGVMRYGHPSIQAAFQEFQNMKIQELIVLPLYPQYSLAATESSIQACHRLAQAYLPQAHLRFIQPFYEHPAFIRSFLKIAQESLKSFSFDHLLLSYHGLPERQIRKTDETGKYCFSSLGCCERETEENRNCYRAHCFATSRRLIEGLGLVNHQYTVTFQSRLGRTPWIQPFTDEVIRRLPSQGVRRLAVLCPAFVADCLETLEEIEIRGKTDFINAGGEDLKLVPSLNSSDIWVEGVQELILGTSTQSSGSASGSIC